MENNLQNILFGIKIKNSLLNNTNFQTKSAFLHYETLNIILNKFVSSSNQLTQEIKNCNFENLQLVIDE